MSLAQDYNNLARISRLFGPVILFTDGRDLFYYVQYDSEELNLQSTFKEDSEFMLQDKLAILNSFCAFSELHGLVYPGQFDMVMAEDLSKWVEYFLEAYEDYLVLHDPSKVSNEPKIKFSNGAMENEIVYDVTLGDLHYTGEVINSLPGAYAYVKQKIGLLHTEVAYLQRDRKLKENTLTSL